MGHRIEVFTDGSPASLRTLGMVEVGKCASCVLVERNLSREPEAHAEFVRTYHVRTVPTIVVDGRIKVEGIPDFAWVCGDEFFAWLEKRFPMR